MQNESKIFSLKKTQYLSLIDEINQKVTDKLASKKLIKNQLEESKSKITNEEFLIAFVGDWSSGKSSLINKILFDEYSQKGVDFLPVLDERTTTRITRIQYGEKTKMFILKNDGSKELLADGEEKVKRIKQVIGDQKFDKIIAFGDTSGDKPMLAFAHESHYRFFN